MDEGHVRHTFAPTKLESSTTHKMDQPISALALALDETTFCSGGWDKKVLVSTCPFVLLQHPHANVAMGSQHWSMYS